MGKYLIADLVWEINFPKGFNVDKFVCFEEKQDLEALHTINFLFVDQIEALKETNHEEIGLKMYCHDGIKSFDIKDEKKVIIRGEYADKKTTFKIIENYEGIQTIIEMLTFMRVSEVSAKLGVITILAAAVSMKEEAIIVNGRNAGLFVENWLKEIDESKLISSGKLFVKIENNIVKLYNNPWCFEEAVKERITLPVKAILFAYRSNENSFIEETDNQKLIELAVHLGIMTDNLSNEELFRFCLELVDKVNILRYSGNVIKINEIFNKIYFS